MADRTYKIPPHLLDDLCSRFILNVPNHIRLDFIRIFFQIELAHWFYIDFFVPEDPSLQSVGIKEFANQVFDHCPFLLSETDDVDTLHRDWRKYKLAVPTSGVILLDPTKKYVLLVQGFSKSWGFPKGKLNEDESFVRAAVRELREETGLDVSDIIDENVFVKHTMGDQTCILYIVPDVPMETHFLPQTRNEIRSLRWFPLSLLPLHKKDVTNTDQLGCGPNTFFMVIPFLKPLNRWIAKNTAQASPQKQEAQKEFNKQLVSHCEEMFEMTSRSGSPGRGGSRRMNKKAAQSQPRHGNRSPMYTLLQKDKREETMKKVSEIKKTYGITTTPPGKTAAQEVDKDLIKPCTEWKNFKLDIGSIMEAAMSGR